MSIDLFAFGGILDIILLWWWRSVFVSSKQFILQCRSGWTIYAKTFLFRVRSKAVTLSHMQIYITI